MTEGAKGLRPSGMDMVNFDDWITEDFLIQIIRRLNLDESRASNILRKRLSLLSKTIHLFDAQNKRPSQREQAEKAGAIQKAIEELLKLIAENDGDGRWKANLIETEFGLELAGGLGRQRDPDSMEKDLQSGKLKRRLQSDIDRIANWYRVAKDVEDHARLRFPKGRGGDRRGIDRVKAQAIQELAATYIDVTGKRPRIHKVGDRASGPFIDFCETILRAMGMPTEPDAIAQQYKRLRSRQRGTNQSPPSN